MVFLSGRGGGQGWFPVQITPSIGLELAGGGTAGRAQWGIVGFAVGGVEWSMPGAVLWSFQGVVRHSGRGHAWGLGAGNGSVRRASRWGSKYCFVGRLLAMVQGVGCRGAGVARGLVLELAAGFGAGGGAIVGAYCGGVSRCVSEHGGGRLFSMVQRVGWQGVGVVRESTNLANWMLAFSSSLTEWRSQRRPALLLVGSWDASHSYIFRSSSASSSSMREGKRRAASEVARV